MNHEVFREKQDNIYAGIATKGEDLGITQGLESDVTEAQGAFLVAWRHPEIVAGRMEEASLAIASVANALTYTRSTLHTTLSDYDLAPGLHIDPVHSLDHEETLDTLTFAVKRGLDTAGARAIAGRRIAFSSLITNGKSVIAPGQPSDELLTINNAVKRASSDLGIANGEGLRGSWGAHATINRFTEPSSIETAARVIAKMHEFKELGLSRPTAIDVGYLAVNAQGFAFTTHSRFPLERE